MNSKVNLTLLFIGVGAQSTLRGTAFLPEKYVWNINKMHEFYMILARKNIKIPTFLWYLPEKLTKFLNFTWFLPENARILHKNCPIFLPIFGGRGATCPLPPSPPLLRLCYCVCEMRRIHCATFEIWNSKRKTINVLMYRFSALFFIGFHSSEETTSAAGRTRM